MADEAATELRWQEVCERTPPATGAPSPNPAGHAEDHQTGISTLTPHADRPTTGPSATLSILKRLWDQVASGPRATILRAPLCHPGVTHVFGIGMAAVRHDEVTGVGPSKSKQPVPSTVY
jgi:hypothetical protein